VKAPGAHAVDEYLMGLPAFLAESNLRQKTGPNSGLGDDPLISV